MQPPPYVPLRVHGHHSLLTGVDSPRALLERASALGLPALALVDVDSIAGLVEAAQERARRIEETVERGLDPASVPRWIYGAEISDPNERFAGRLIALCKNEAGYKNLCRLVSARRLGEDPGEVAGSALPEEGEKAFDRVDCATRFQEGLIYLVDHPELLIQLAPRLDSRHLFAALAPAGLSKSPLEATSAPGRTRNVTLEPKRPPIPRRPLAETDGSESGSKEEAHALEEPKTPPPAVSVP
ncbi:MAG: PHP domain-containing protein, partial [Planctomycetota bacterium]